MSIVVALGKLFGSIMLLLITFLAHSFFTYINKRLHVKTTATRIKRRQPGGNETADASMFMLNATRSNELNTFLCDDSIDFRRQEHAESSRCEFIVAPASMDVEPELFTFNESFDANLLDINKQQPNQQSEQSNRSIEVNLNSSPNISTSSSEFLFEHSVELLKNLNKLYNNQLEQAAAVGSMMTIAQNLSFESELFMRNEESIGQIEMSGETMSVRDETLTLSDDDEFVEFDMQDESDDVDEHSQLFSNGN